MVDCKVVKKEVSYLENIADQKSDTVMMSQVNQLY